MPEGTRVAGGLFSDFCTGVLQGNSRSEEIMKIGVLKLSVFYNILQGRISYVSLLRSPIEVIFILMSYLNQKKFEIKHLEPGISSLDRDP